jgi:hypothetical protein
MHDVALQSEARVRLVQPQRRVPNTQGVMAQMLRSILGMDFNPWMQTTEYVRIGLWIANLLVYGCAIWLYLRPEKAASPRSCALCGSDSDALCVGVHRPDVESKRLNAAPRQAGATRV